MDKENPPAAPAPASAPAPTPAPAQPENTIRVEGILDLDNSRNGQLLDLAKFGKRRPTDPFVPRELT
jgi:transcription termination factor Rho